MRSISSCRPISGSILPASACALRFVVKRSSGFDSAARSLSAADSSWLGLARFLHLRHAVRDEVDDVEPRDVLQSQQVDGLRLLLAEDRDEHVDRRDFLAAARLHVEHGALQDPLETQRRLDLGLLRLLRRAGAEWRLR